MPSLMLEVPETYVNITRPITTEVIKDLINRLELPNNTKVTFTGNAEVAAQRGSTLAHANEDVSFPYDGKVTVKQLETPLEGHSLITATRGHENPAIFLDRSLGVSIHPIYTRTENSITFTYRAPDQVTIEKWRYHLRRKSSEGMKELLHEIHYHYSPPEPFLTLLREIYELREGVEGYGDTFNEYLLQHFTPRLTTLSNLSGSQQLGAITEKQIEILGWFDFTEEPSQPDKSRDGDAWEMSFTYTFHYDKVTSMVMFYPIVVHNQLLDEKFIDTRRTYSAHMPKKRLMTQSGKAMDGFRHSNHQLTRKGIESVKVPYYDDWSPSGVRLRTMDMFTSLIGVDYDEPRLIVDLLDLGETQLSDDVVTFLKEGRHLLQHYLGLPFLVSFYRGDQMVSASQIEIDEALVVRHTDPLYGRDVHHLKFSVFYDLKNLSVPGKELILNHPSVARKVIDLVHGWDDPYLGSLGNHYGKGRKRYDKQKRPSYTIHPGDTTGPNPNIKPPSGMWQPGRDGTIQPGGVGGGEDGAGSKPGDKFEGRPSDWLEETDNGRITEASWDAVVGGIVFSPILRQRHVSMQTVMQAGIIAHPKPSKYTDPDRHQRLTYAHFNQSS